MTPLSEIGSLSATMSLIVGELNSVYETLSNSPLSETASLWKTTTPSGARPLSGSATLSGKVIEKICPPDVVLCWLPYGRSVRSSGFHLCLAISS